MNFSISCSFWILLLSCWIHHCSGQTQGDTQYDTPESAQKDPDFLIQGEYAGPSTGLQVVAQGDGDFEIVVYAGGLPGAGWDRSTPQRIEGDASNVANIVESRKLKRIERKSPTLNAAPPSEAIVLFDGSTRSLTEHWQSGAKKTEDGLLMQGATTKATFRDYTLHLEFRTPFEPKREGQGRGNSGVYHQGRYETQVLDSFGLKGSINETGGIYSVRDPDLNMCFPPLTWQTYDVDFTAPRFDPSGKKTSDAKLTVRLNGVLVQNDVAVPHVTTAAPVSESKDPGPIYLQDHGNPVRFRNIWIVPRDAEQEARRPVVMGFERHVTDEALAGRLLLSQLSCTACHATEDESLAPHRGPVLDQVGSRLRFDQLVALTSDAHGAKPGTTMPDLFYGQTPEQRHSTGLAIASFLATTGTLIDRSGDHAALKRGEELYHSIGCIACHAPRRGDIQAGVASIPLGNIASKYSLEGLTNFLANPHAIRPDGIMPRLANSHVEARDIACYLIGEQIIAPGAEQYSVKVYHGSWSKLPDFDSLKPVKTGVSSGLDLSIADRTDNFALQFEAYLPISVDGEYKFTIASDDGSRLWIDGEAVVTNDGVHPVIEKSGTRKLARGVHALRIDYFEGGGGEDLLADVEGPDHVRAPLSLLITSDPKGLVQKELIPSKNRPVPGLVAQGKKLFETVGCASCHSLEIQEKQIGNALKGPELKALVGTQGCLSKKVEAGLPQFDLSQKQKQAILAALKVLQEPLAAQSKLHLQLSAKNCYACHLRGTQGGPDASSDSWFLTKTPEMGNEGRLPPPLTGVGDKLRPEIIEQIITQGSKDRPYMVTRMPAFGPTGAKGFRELFSALDQKNSGRKSITASLESDKPWIGHGRKLVGSEGLSCVKCHVFAGKGAPGLQAIDLARMHERLREDWFHRYMLAPTEYRPGTRMPLSFTDGKSTLTSILDGDADKQVDAMWLYLLQGATAKPPSGIDAEAIVLVPDTKPIIYRNFIEGLGPRGIAVGYPEKVNLAWDAGSMNVVLLWKNDFIDASKHWVGRGPGFQGPHGDDIIKLQSSALVARMEKWDAPWPNKTSRQQGAKFLGYHLNKLGQPSFNFRLDEVEVTDTFTPLRDDQGVGFQRTLAVKISEPTPGLVCRIAVGNIVPSAEANTYLVDGQIKLQCEGSKIELLQVGGRQELRWVLPESGSVTFKETIRW